MTWKQLLWDLRCKLDIKRTDGQRFNSRKIKFILRILSLTRHSNFFWKVFFLVNMNDRKKYFGKFIASQNWHWQQISSYLHLSIWKYSLDNMPTVNFSNKIANAKISKHFLWDLTLSLSISRKSAEFRCLQCVYSWYSVVAAVGSSYFSSAFKFFEINCC